MTVSVADEFTQAVIVTVACGVLVGVGVVDWPWWYLGVTLVGYTIVGVCVELAADSLFDR